MPSDLASLLSGSDSGDFTNPATAAIAPRMKLAQALLQSGSDASAVQHPAQALARAVQGITGGYMQRQATSDLAQAYNTTAEGLASSLEKVSPGHPLVAALRSADPNTRAMAVQQGIKALSTLPEQAEKIRQFNVESGQKDKQIGLKETELNKPSLETASTDPMTGKKTFVWSNPLKQTVAPANPVMPQPKSADEYNALPKGSQYMDPQGNIRTKT